MRKPDSRLIIEAKRGDIVSHASHCHVGWRHRSASWVCMINAETSCNRSSTLSTQRFATTRRWPCKIQTINDHLESELEFVTRGTASDIVGHCDCRRIGSWIQLPIEPPQVRAFLGFRPTLRVLPYCKPYDVVRNSNVSQSREFRGKTVGQKHRNPTFTGFQPIRTDRDLRYKHRNELRVRPEYPIEFLSNPSTSQLPRLPRGLSFVENQFTENSIDHIRQYFGLACDVSVECRGARTESVGEHTHVERLRAHFVDGLKRRSYDPVERDGRAPGPTVPFSRVRPIQPPFRTPRSIWARSSSHISSLSGMGMAVIYRAARSRAVRMSWHTKEAQQKYSR